MNADRFIADARNLLAAAPTMDRDALRDAVTKLEVTIEMFSYDYFDHDDDLIDALNALHALLD